MAPTGARARHREVQTEAIKATARELIAEGGVNALSLREVARRRGLVSSALFRYFASRDDLLTALILDAYNDLGAAVERAEARVERDQVRERWRATCRAVRRWSRRHPHEYGLIYGTPVPEYSAPIETIAAATRVPEVMGRILADDRAAKRRSSRRAAPPTFLEVEAIAAVMPGVSPADFPLALLAWSHVFGHVSFELFGHFVGSIRDADAAFDDVIERLADLLGLGSSSHDR